jgi:hypothetical protein
MSLTQPTDPTILKRTLDAIDALVAQAKAAHPELGLSVGYIGNLERWGDDRDWRVFTNRRDSTGRSISFSLGSTDSLDDAKAKMAAHYLPRFLARALEAAKAPY